MKPFLMTETLKLQYPVKWGDDTVSHLEFRRLKAKDLRGLPKDEGAQAQELVCRSTGQPPSLIGDLDLADFRAAGDIVAGFLGNSQATGDKSSGGLPVE